MVSGHCSLLRDDGHRIHWLGHADTSILLKVRLVLLLLLRPRVTVDLRQELTTADSFTASSLQCSR